LSVPIAGIGLGLQSSPSAIDLMDHCLRKSAFAAVQVVAVERLVAEWIGPWLDIAARAIVFLALNRPDGSFPCAVPFGRPVVFRVSPNAVRWSSLPRRGSSEFLILIKVGKWGTHGSSSLVRNA
jgi:hypothetical protein